MSSLHPPAGIQKNLCRWFSHDPSFVPAIHPAKLAGAAPASPTKLASSKGAVHPPPTPRPAAKGKGKGAEREEEEEEQGEGGEDEEKEFRSAAQPGGDKQGEGHGLGKLAALGAVEVEQERVIDLDGEAGALKEEDEDKDKVEEEKKEEEEVEGGEFEFPETSNGLTPGVLKARLGGKKLKCVALVPLLVVVPVELRLTSALLARPQGQHLPHAQGDGGAHGELEAVPLGRMLVRRPLSLPLRRRVRPGSDSLSRLRCRYLWSLADGDGDP